MENKSLNFNTLGNIKYKCTLCDGEHASFTNGVCPRCKGEEYIEKRIKPGNYHEHNCDICSGTGHNPFNKNECFNCEGTGKIIIDVEPASNLWNFS